jgi:AraC-like DNA-binding protein
MIYHYDPNASTTAGTLEELGFDTAYHPGYTNSRKRLHGVDVILLTCLISGRGTHYLGGQTFREEGGSLSVLNYGQQHDVVTDEPMDVMNLFLDPSRHPLPILPGGLQHALTNLISLHPGLANQTNRVVRLPVSRSLQDTLFILHSELRNDEPGALTSAQHLFASFLVQLCRQAAVHGVTRLAADVRLERVRGVIDARFAEPLRLDELAAEAGLSRTYLCTQFRRYTGQTVFEYITSRRLEAVLVRLRSSDEKIAVVASECGFRDLGFFNRTFRSRLGTTPGEYRQRMQIDSRNE